MIIVTGGAGFIGSNIVHAFNGRGENDILIVDHIGKGEKFKNLIGLKFYDIWSKEKFSEAIADLDDVDPELQAMIEDVECVFHMGACSDTMELDGDYMLRNNYEYSKAVCDFCDMFGLPMIYASSASTYGLGARGFREEPECEHALNHYAFSKLLFDRKVRDEISYSDNVLYGMRFFNVYGPQEHHKGRMASIFYQMYNQLKRDGVIRLFKGIDGAEDGEQRRDFIYVGDVVKVCLWFFDQSNEEEAVESGVYNCGTGHAHSYNEAARAMIKAVGHGSIEYVDFPNELRGKYQNFTQADTTKLIDAGYDGGFTELDEAVAEYVELLDRNGGYFFD